MSSGPASPPLLPSPTALIVHLDLNKTCLMVDAAAGNGDARSLLSSVLAAAAWGRVAEAAALPGAATWTLAAPLLRARA